MRLDPLGGMGTVCRDATGDGPDRPCRHAEPHACAVHVAARRRGALRAPLRRPAGSLGSFVAGFKASCTRQINAIRNVQNVPVWQRGYWEHIVRDEGASSRIYGYIETNPLRWELDRENP